MSVAADNPFSYSPSLCDDPHATFQSSLFETSKSRIPCNTSLVRVRRVGDG